MKDYHFIERDNILPSLKSLLHLSSKLKNAIEHSLCVEEQIYFGLGVSGRPTMTPHISYFSCPQSFSSQIVLVELRETPTLKLHCCMMDKH